jgi:hypothetical protein
LIRGSGEKDKKNNVPCRSEELQGTNIMLK